MKQRRGIVESVPDAAGPVVFLNAALKANVPLADPIPLPFDLMDALDFTSTNPAATVLAFREHQLSRLAVFGVTLPGGLGPLVFPDAGIHSPRHG